MNSSYQRSHSIKSVSRAVDVLKCFGEGTVGVTDISNMLKINKVTVHRMLKTLAASGFVLQDPATKKYCLGRDIISLALNPVLIHQRLVFCAYQDMTYLRDLTEETVVLEVQSGIQRMNLEEVESKQLMKFSEGKGYQVPLYIGAGGKALLAQFKPADLQVYMKTINLLPIGPNTITDKKALASEIEKIRSQGYSSSVGERISWCASIAVPIANYILPVSLSIVGPTNRWLPKMEDFLKELQEAGKRISKNISL